MVTLGWLRSNQTSSVSTSFKLLTSHFIVKFWNVTTRVFILRVGRENLDMACTSLMFLTAFSEAMTEAGAPCRVRILHVGGTLEKVEKRYKQLSEAWLETTQKKIEDAGAAAAM